jgi:ribosome-binding protein aMBF1 (putative translation factor)
MSGDGVMNRERINLTELFGPRDSKLQAEIRLQMELAQKLYDLREARGLSQLEVAAMAGTTLAVIESIEESDHDPRRSRQILDKLAKALNLETPASLTPAVAVGTVSPRAG